MESLEQIVLCRTEICAGSGARSGSRAACPCTNLVMIETIGGGPQQVLT
jgi:hypothetical protein